MLYYCQTQQTFNNTNKCYMFHVAFTNDIIKGLFCLTVIYVTLLSQHNGVDSIKIIRHMV